MTANEPNKQSWWGTVITRTKHMAQTLARQNSGLYNLQTDVQKNAFKVDIEKMFQEIGNTDDTYDDMKNYLQRILTEHLNSLKDSVDAEEAFRNTQESKLSHLARQKEVEVPDISNMFLQRLSRSIKEYHSDENSPESKKIYVQYVLALKKILDQNQHSNEINPAFDDLFPHAQALANESPNKSSSVICGDVLKMKDYFYDLKSEDITPLLLQSLYYLSDGQTDQQGKQAFLSEKFKKLRYEGQINELEALALSDQEPAQSSNVEGASTTDAALEEAVRQGATDVVQAHIGADTSTSHTALVQAARHEATDVVQENIGGANLLERFLTAIKNLWNKIFSRTGGSPAEETTSVRVAQGVTPASSGAFQPEEQSTRPQSGETPPQDPSDTNNPRRSGEGPSVNN